MIRLKHWLLAAFVISSPLIAEESQGVDANRVVPKADEKPFTSFTGRVLGSRVRMRGQPDLEGYIVDELRGGDCLVVLGEQDGYYAVRPPSGMKAYVFRTFVLDNVVEGSRVNVRLQPDLDSPIIAQLNTGDRVDGQVSPVSNKWLEINPPEGVAFFVAKEYIERVGDANYLARHEERISEVGHLLNSACLTAQSELSKSFEEIDLEKVQTAFNRVITDYSDFAEEGERARAVLEMAQDVYLQKKVAFLEAQAQRSAETWDTKSRKLGAELQTYQQRLGQLQALIAENCDEHELAALVEEEPEVELYQDGKDLHQFEPQVEREEVAVAVIERMPRQVQHAQRALTDKMRQWIAVEDSLYHLWAINHGNRSKREFYSEEMVNAETVTGIVERYNRPVKNRPGDFILRLDSMPVAYLYSTKVDLDEKVGSQVTLRVTRRPNNNFAFPAFFVHSVE